MGDHRNKSTGRDRTGARQQNARGQSGLRAGASTSHDAPWCLLQLQRLPSHLVTDGAVISTAQVTQQDHMIVVVELIAVSLSTMDRSSM